MPLTAPPDYSKVLIPAVLGLTVALCIFALTRSNLPHVGDNIHSLPHGGNYKDGTKCVTYKSPGKNFPSSNLFGSGGKFQIAAFVILLIGLIHALSKRSGNLSPGCAGCSIHPARN